MRATTPAVLTALTVAGCGGTHLTPPPPPPIGPSEGCQHPLAPGAVTLETEIQGLTRRYIVVVPDTVATSSAPLALVFGFHGQSWTAEAFRDGGGGPEKISGGTAVFVYPNGQPRVGGSGWDLDLDGSDVEFFDVMYRDVLAKTCVDTRRVFVFGRSYGAYFANTLGCARGNYLAGLAALMGGGPPGDGLSCQAVSAWIYHAADDQTVAVTEGRKARDHYVLIDGCSGGPEATMPGGCVRYPGCANGKRLVYCENPTGGHNPPDWSASAMWSFFTAISSASP
ncbi:MAG: hypothetical protein U1E65_26155 [Myxococcota bacterium]